MSRIASCLEAAHHFLLSEGEALAVVEAQLRSLGKNWDAVCTEADLSKIDCNFLWGRQFLNPFAFTALGGEAAALAKLADDIRSDT